MTVADAQKHLSSALTTIADPTSTKVRLDSATEPAHMEAAYYTREAHLSIVGEGIPAPAPGHVYRVWLLGASGNQALGDFRPDDGLVVLNLVVNVTRFSRLVITEERAGPAGRGPAGIKRWATGL